MEAQPLQPLDAAESMLHILSLQSQPCSCVIKLTSYASSASSMCDARVPYHKATEPLMRMCCMLCCVTSTASNSLGVLLSSTMVWRPGLGINPTQALHCKHTKH